MFPNAVGCIDCTLHKVNQPTANQHLFYSGHPVFPFNKYADNYGCVQTYQIRFIISGFQGSANDTSQHLRLPPIVLRKELDFPTENRPTANQHLFYSGHRHFHSISTQIIVDVFRHIRLGLSDLDSKGAQMTQVNIYNCHQLFQRKNLIFLLKIGQLPTSTCFIVDTDISIQ